MGKLVLGAQCAIESGARRVLLINPPVYDLRLDWARWQQPCGLQRIGQALHRRGADVRFFDILAAGNGDGGRMTRRLSHTVQVDGETLSWWCFGLPWVDVGRRFRQWRADGWQPDEVWVTSLTSFWWRGVQETIRRLRYDWQPQARIVLGGVYPTHYAEHALANAEADLIVQGSLGLAGDYADPDAAASPEAGVYLYGEGRSPDDVVHDLAARARSGVREVAFFDEEIPGPDPDRFDYVLQQMALRRLKLRLMILGNMPAAQVTWPRAAFLHDAGLSEVYLRWDPSLNGDLRPYIQAADLLHTFAGLKPRAGALSAVVYAGWPGEDIEETAHHLLQLSHAVGSVTLFPYQPTRAEGERLGISEPDELNGKLFPFAHANGVRFGDYADLLRLAATLNSKYRDVTFDFLGHDLIARMVRTSIRGRLWQPAVRRDAGR